MSDEIQIGITSNAAEVIRQLQDFPQAMAQSIAHALDHENELTVGEIQARKLSQRGPTTLGVISNRLRLSVRRTDAIVDGTTVSSAIGSNVKYAGVHEFGFTGTVLVREHRARHHALDVYRVRNGRTAKGWELTGTMDETDSKRATRIAEGFVMVRAHQMRMNIPARAPFRTTIAERTEHYSAAVSNAIVNAWGGAN